MNCEPGCNGRVGLDYLEDCSPEEVLEVYECCKDCMTINERLYCARIISNKQTGGQK